jgi:hypothetical protein
MANMQVIAKTKPPASADMQLITGNQHRNPHKEHADYKMQPYYY